jgi:hypothetical protein
MKEQYLCEGFRHLHYLIVSLLAWDLGLYLSDKSQTNHNEYYFGQEMVTNSLCWVAPPSCQRATRQLVVPKSMPHTSPDRKNNE